MALIHCPECTKKISDKADACPHCGLPKAYFCAPPNTIQTTPKINKHTKAELDYKTLRNMLISFDKDYAEVFNSRHYISSSTAGDFQQNYSYYVDILNDPIVRQYIANHEASLGLSPKQCKRFVSLMEDFYEKVDTINEEYVSRKLVEHKIYFDKMLKAVDPQVILDTEQRRAVVTDDNYCLLIAGAGAGKTTTMAAKVKYLVDKQGISPDDIIVISYTNKAINELKERVNKKLHIPVKICTFHSFGYELLRKTTDIPPGVNFKSYNIIFKFLEKTVYANKRLLNSLVKFLGYYFDLPHDVFSFRSLNDYCTYKANLDFETIKSRLGEYIKKVASGRSKRNRTITGEFLRSAQEVQIANFLYLYNIEYEYEKPYSYQPPGARKLYTPDFYIYQGENYCYIEHFGIRENFQSELYSKTQMEKYIHGIIAKRRLHKQHGTRLMQTWSEYNDGRPLLDHLKENLEELGFILKPRDSTEVYRKLAETGKDKFVLKLIFFLITFIQNYKACGYDEAGFNVLRKKTDNVRTLLFLDIAEEVYKHYQEELQKNNEIDFSDMINDAERIIRELSESPYKPSYKYIIIDEFQDIARQRFNLTKSLADVTGAKVVAVGDDWQSIFAFAGADITLFQKFLELMGDGREMQITHTYRNSQELIDIAGGFIQKNPSQIQKRLISPKRLENPIVIEAYNDSEDIRYNWATKIEEVIGKIIKEYGDKQSILMVGRYNFDMYNLVKTGKFIALKGDKIKSRQYPKADITFLTAHTSKGLGFDNVILLNMLEAKFGFPSQIEDDPIMKLVTYTDYSIPFAEERRLFYVAMTRTKNRVYMITPKKKPSRFVLELIKDFKIPCSKNLNLQPPQLRHLQCPLCMFPLKFESNKNYGIPLYICTNEPEICDFMTNDRTVRADIFKCPKCPDGYMVVKMNTHTRSRFYGCTNFSEGGCTHRVDIKHQFSKHDGTLIKKAP